ncbi:MAG TPA: peptidase M4 [Chloroflexi bacterium]|nr:peptidase M4 [Chloroflexota bacterium]
MDAPQTGEQRRDDSPENGPQPGLRTRKEFTMQTRARRWLMGAGAGTLLLLGGAAAGPLTTFAQNAPATPSTQQVTTQKGDTNEQWPNYTGSISVPDTQDNSSTSEADEAAALQHLAKITSADAEKAALAANSGTTVTSSSLGNENGWLVYEVKLSSGVEVKVDAGNGSILATEQADTNESEGAEKGVDHDQLQSQSTNTTDSTPDTGQ